MFPTAPYFWKEGVGSRVSRAVLALASRWAMSCSHPGNP
jgi:hypothetical protein